MFATLFDRPTRNFSSVEDVPNEIDVLDEEDGYDRFSKSTKYEFESPYDSYKEIQGENDEVDLEDFYDRDLSME